MKKLIFCMSLILCLMILCGCSSKNTAKNESVQVSKVASLQENISLEYYEDKMVELSNGLEDSNLKKSDKDLLIASHELEVVDLEKELKALKEEKSKNQDVTLKRALLHPVTFVDDVEYRESSAKIVIIEDRIEKLDKLISDYRGIIELAKSED